MLRGIGRLRAGGGQVPSLSLDFVSSETADSRITVSGGAGGTRVNSSGNIVAASAPRFDFDPVTLAARGVLVEEQRTNLLLQSAAFDNASWTKSASTATADQATGPDGALSADLLKEDGTTAAHTIQQTPSYTSGQVYTFSVYAKAKERTRFNLQINSGASIFAAQQQFLFDLTTVTATKGTGTNTTGTITAVGGGWYRCTMTTDAASGTGSSAALIALRDAAGGQSYAGDGTSGMYLWGAQLEAGSFATSYIPTTTAAVTRTADSLTMTGSNFSSWWNAAQGTFVTEHTFEGTGSGGTTRILEAHDGTASNRIILGDTGTLARGLISTGGATQYDQNASYGAQSPRKSALSFQASDFQIAAAGSLGTAGASGSVPAVTALSIGGSNGLVFGGIWVRRIKFIPTRLPNAQDQVMTQ